MSYLGGKAKGADHILEILNHEIFDGLHYYEPFVGYCHILRRVENKKSYHACDSNKLLIALLKGLQENKKYHIFLKRSTTGSEKNLRLQM